MTILIRKHALKYHKWLGKEVLKNSQTLSKSVLIRKLPVSVKNFCRKTIKYLPSVQNFEP